MTLNSHEHCDICGMHYPLYADGMWRGNGLYEASSSEAGSLIGPYIFLIFIVVIGWLGDNFFIMGFGGSVFLLYSIFVIPYFLNQLRLELKILFHKPSTWRE